MDVMFGAALNVFISTEALYTTVGYMLGCAVGWELG